MLAAAAHPALSRAGVTDVHEKWYQEVFSVDKTVQRSVPSAFHWSADGQHVAFAGVGDAPSFQVVDAATGALTYRASVDALAKSASQLCSKAISGGELAQSIVSVSASSLRLALCETLIDVDFATGEASVVKDADYADLAMRRPRVIGTTFPDKAFLSNAVMESAAPDARHFLGLVDDNIYIRAAGDEPQVITDDAHSKRPWALQTAIWSDDGRQVAVLRKDNAGVMTTPLVDWEKDYGVSEAMAGPIVGSQLTKLDLYVIDVETKEARLIGSEPNGYWLIAGFSSDTVIMRRMGRRIHEHELLAINSETGKRRSLFEESTETFFMPWLYANSYMSLGDEGFLWVPEKAAHRNIEHRNAKGKLVRQITKRDLSVFDVLHVDKDAGYVYYNGPASDERPYDRHLWRAPINGGAEELLTPEEGQHVILFSPTGSAFVDIHSDVNLPPRMILRHADGTAVATLATSTVNSADLWGEHPPEPFVVKAADGKTDLHGVLYKPRDFDPKKSYPLIHFVYGGPHAMITQRHFGPGQLTWGGTYVSSAYMNKAPALAQLGYVTFTVDARGSFGRERDFHTSAYHGVGERDIADYRGAIEQLAKDRPFMDTSRVGIYGRSFGGYMTVRGMLRAPDVYKVGVASAPIRIGPDAQAPLETYFGDPGSKKNKDALVNSANATHAAALEGQLLLILATLDVEVPFEEGMHLTDAFVRAGKYIDMMVLPGQNHMFQYADSPPYTELRDDYRNDLIRAYFLEHLAP
ncbi:MAG: prolyl oligopeptidase family serine peptidase [Pseudomonadota bacterium]